MFRILIFLFEGWRTMLRGPRGWVSLREWFKMMFFVEAWALWVWVGLRQAVFAQGRMRVFGWRLVNGRFVWDR